MLKEDKKMKDLHNEAYKNINPNQKLIDNTFELMKKEFKKENRNYLYSFRNNQKVILAVSFSILFFIGINFYKNIYTNNFVPPQSGEINNKFDSPQLDETIQTVNISGVIEKVDESISAIRISGKWVIIDENTEFFFKDDGTEVSRNFEVGNYVEAFTYDSINLPEVKASYIYLNE